MPLDLRAATQATFAPHVGTNFELEREDRPPLVLRLEQVYALPSSPHAPRAAFGLGFSTAEPGALPQHIYPLRHAALGELEVFVVPSGPRDGRMRYDVIFG